MGQWLLLLVACLLVAGSDLLQVKAKANWQSEGREGWV